MMNFNKISVEELCKILNVSSLRTLQTTKGFPLFDEEKLLFDKKEISNFFNLDNIDEPFISLKEASEYTGLSSGKIIYLIKTSQIPSYRIKSIKGSGYLFRKSELDVLKDIIFEGNVDFVNVNFTTNLFTNLFSVYIEEKFNITYDSDNTSIPKEYEIFMLYFFEKTHIDEIAKKFNLSRKNTYDILRKFSFRMREEFEAFCKSSNIELKREIIHQNIQIKSQDIEIKYLKKIIYLNKIIEGVEEEQPEQEDDSKNKLDSLKYKYLFFLERKIADNYSYFYDNKEMFLSNRAIKAIYNTGAITVYDLINLYGGHHVNNISVLRNVGKKTECEILDYIRFMEKKLEEITNISCVSFMMKIHSNKDYVFLFNVIHEILRGQNAGEKLNIMLN